MDYPNDQAPGAPVRSGIPEHGRIPKYYAVKAQIAALTQDAILAALGWQDLAHLTLCPADAGGRGRPYPDMVLTAFLRTGAADAVGQLAVVGDTAYDMLSGAGATHVLGSVAELPALLTQLEPQTRSTMSAMESTTFVGR